MRVAVADTRLFLEGRNEELARAAARAHGSRRPADQRYEEAAQLRDAIRTVEAVRERQQKMATAGLNDRDVIGVKLGARRRGRSGVRVPRRARDRAVRAADRTPAGARPSARMRCRAVWRPSSSKWRCSSSTPTTCRRPRFTCRVEPTDRDVLEAWLSARAERRVRIVVPQRGDKKDMVELAQRNAAFAYRTRFDTDATAHYDALELLQGDPEAAGAAAPHRMLRHLDDPGQRDRGVDGGLRGRPDEEERLPQVPRPARRSPRAATDMLPAPARGAISSQAPVLARQRSPRGSSMTSRR